MALSIPIPEKLLSLVTEKIAPIIKVEAQKILSASELVDGIKNEMEIAKDFLKKTEEKADKATDRIKKRVRELRELVYKIEDALDEYELLEHHHHQSSYQNEENDNSGCITGVREFLLGSSTAIIGFKSKHGIACNIVRIRKAMEKIKGNEKSYEESIFNHIEGDSNSGDDDDDIEEQRERGKNLNHPGFYPLYKDEEELVGFKDRKEELIRKLDLENKKYCKGQFVLAMWGLPGVGKTTLARKVYEDEDVRTFFSCFAWITATRPYKSVDLLKCLFQQFVHSSPVVAAIKDDSVDSISEQEVQKLQDNEVVITDRLRSYLKKNHPESRYLVVLDDVSEKSQLSKIIKAALVPSHSEGGRMLMTTRSEGIANYWKTSSSHGETYSLPILSEKQAQDLFNKYAFGGNMNCPWKLQSLRDTIVKECDGLPFLIEKVGAVFSTTQKWIELYHDFQINPLKSKKYLLSSYHDMPYHLKPCFLYLCMFPKGYKLERMRMVRLWIAEGFVKGKECNTPEEAAEEYLNELVERGMVHLLENDDTGRQRIFRLPCMWRHIMLPKLADQSFCHVFSQNKFSTKNSCRRLSIHDDLQDTVISPSVRSVLSFVHPKRFPISWSLPFREGSFKLKVLDLQNAKFTEIPPIMGNLHNLCYLSLRNTEVKELPTSIRGLWNLQTLDLKYAPVKSLPEEINRLHKLRHLIVSHSEEGTKKRIPVIIAKDVLKSLTELQKLAFLEGSANGVVNELMKLTQLRRLAIVNLKESDSETFCKALESMKLLRSLLISTISNEIIDLNHTDSPPEFLERLYLEGPLKGNKLPKWISKLEHLVRVRLINSGFTSDPLASIRKMEDLLVLELDNTHQSKVLNFGYSAFKKLRVLKIKKLGRLDLITAGEKALCQLEKAECEDCPLLDENSIPPQIHKVLEKKVKLPFGKKGVCEVGEQLLKISKKLEVGPS